MKVITNSQGKIYTANGKALISPATSPVITSLNVTPTTSAQTITAPSGTDGYSPVNVSAVTSNIDANITAENIKKDVTILNVTGTYEGSGGGGEFQLTRIKDDTNTEIGTHYMDFTDGNGQKYKVVCLDAKYRMSNVQWCSSASGYVTNLPTYTSIVTPWGDSKETATFNTQKILDYCSSAGYTSSMCNYARSNSFRINGITYYGQVPNMKELCSIFFNKTIIQSMDSSATGGYSSSGLNTAKDWWSSNQNSDSRAWFIGTTSIINHWAKTGSFWLIPVLEIPY